MKSRIFVLVTIIVFAVLATPTRSAAQEQQETENGRTRYTVINLGTFGGTSGSSANGVNNNGLVTGIEVLPNGDQHAFLWVNGRKKDLGTLGGPESAITTAANENGTIIGEADTAAQDPLAENFCAFNNPNMFLCLLAIWRNGVIAPLPTLGGNNGEASGINNRGQAVGWAETATLDPSCIAPQVLDFEAVVWDTQRGEVRELPPLPGDSIGAAGAINDKGEIVGTSGPTCQPFSPAIGAHIVLWYNGTPIDLGNLGGSTNNVALGINNRGQVTGFSGLTGDTTFHAFLWQNGVMTDLGTLPGDFSSVAFGINNRGQIVGQSCDANFNCRGFLWEDGAMTDLNSLISAGSPLYLLAGEWMNSGGEITGAAFDQSTGATVPVLLTPRYEKLADNKASEDTAQDTTADTQRPNVILPESVREQLQRRMAFGRFRGQLGGAR